MRVLEGKYHLAAPIASGGMATVYLGKVVGVGGFERQVAIKLMHPHLAAERPYVEMFLDEARLAARIRHPNVVATLDVGESADGPFIVMELIEGPTLAQILKHMRKRGERLPLDVALRVFADALGGLHAAHELCDGDKRPLNLVHRDVSPQNVMVGLDGITRISDFGVARAEVRLSSTRSGELKGKLCYLPPEQIKGDSVDRRADIYAAGCVLFEVLTGQRLFKAETEASLLYKLIAGADRSPRQIDPSVPDAIDIACMRALALAPEERYATAADFGDALDGAARKAGVMPATIRAVAALTKSLGIELPTATHPPPPLEASTAPPDAKATHPEPPSVATATAVTSAVSMTQPRSRAWIWVIAAFALGAAVALLLVRRGGDPVTTGAASAASPMDMATSAAPIDEPAPTAAPDDAAPATTQDAGTAESATSSAAARPPIAAPAPQPQPSPPVPTPPKPDPGKPNAEYQPEAL